MIQVENLSKYYGTFPALKGVSFEVPTGQVLGFLGPNGAGKSTTMKILTGYLYASGGSASVDGIDVAKNPLEVRRRVGYLPETNPLYADMRVDDYLRFVAQVRGLRGSDVKSGIDRVVGVCGLQKVFKKGIDELSKGFKQRVGLAQAMVHDPQILVLDEPTSGLDPNQIVEIRELIRSLGANRTVILSTHYLQEVDAAADRTIIVAGGQIVADGDNDELCGRLPAGPLTVEILGPVDTVRQQLGQAFPGANIEAMPSDGDGAARFRVDVRQGLDRDAREAVNDLVGVNNWKLLELHRKAATLEDVFRHYTANGATASAAPPPIPAALAGAGDASEGAESGESTEAQS